MLKVKLFFLPCRLQLEGKFALKELRTDYSLVVQSQSRGKITHINLHWFQIGLYSAGWNILWNTHPQILHLTYTPSRCFIKLESVSKVKPFQINLQTSTSKLPSACSSWYKLTLPTRSSLYLLIMVSVCVQSWTLAGIYCFSIIKKLFFASSIKWMVVGHFQSWALPVFFYFFNNKKWFCCTFYQVNNLFLHQSYLKSPLQVKLTWKKRKKIIFN